jgi:hypothetical protein
MKLPYAPKVAVVRPESFPSPVIASGIDHEQSFFLA